MHYTNAKQAYVLRHKSMRDNPRRQSRHSMRGQRGEASTPFAPVILSFSRWMAAVKRLRDCTHESMRSWIWSAHALKSSSGDNKPRGAVESGAFAPDALEATICFSGSGDDAVGSGRFPPSGELLLFSPPDCSMTHEISLA